jgi:hypothetical protein
MFENEFKDLLSVDRPRMERMLELAVRDMIHTVDSPELLTQENLAQKCANIRAVFKLASVLRAARTNA